jgi:cell shape-determining protein MreC
MLMRISLIIAIVVGLAAAVLSFTHVKTKIDNVVAERNDWHGKFDKTDAELTETKGTLAKTEKELTQTKETLATTQKERDDAVAKSEVESKKSADLAEKLNKTTTERDDARAELAAYQNTGYKPEQILALGKQVLDGQKALEASIEEKKILQYAYEKANNELERITGKRPYITMRADLKGSVLVADPKWEFVVLNVGQEDGAKEHGELLVSRDGKLVAKVIIREVQKNRCIANLLPGWKLTDVTEGDVVIPAYPES